MESFIRFSTKSLFRLFCVVMVVYISTHSFIVGLLVAIVVVGWAYHRIKELGRTIPAAPKVSDGPQRAHAPEPQQQAPAPAAKQYAKSAVVVSLARSGTPSRV